jgi:malate dehydrogenase
MVPVPSLCKIGDVPLSDALDADTIDRLVDRTRKGGAEIVAYLKTGSAYYAPSAAAASMVRAIIEDNGDEMPVCAWMEGQYGIDGVYLGVIAKLGRDGVTEVSEVDLTDPEIEALREAAVAVAEKVTDLEEIDH